MTEAKTFDVTVQLVVHRCATCSTPFGIERELLDVLKSRHERARCPAGHETWLTTTIADQLRAELDTAKRDKTWADESAARARAEEGRMGFRVRALRGLVTKLQRKLRAGS